MSVSITLSFPDVAAAAAAMTRLAAVPTGDKYLPATAPAIKYEDRPDVGAEVAQTPAIELPLAFNPFAAGSTVAAASLTPQIPAAAFSMPQEVAAAPVPPTAATPPERDSTGLPWDARIHGSTKSTNADGTWRQKRGLNDPALKARVEAELRAAVSAGSPPAGSVASVASTTAAPVAPPPAPPVVASTPPTSAPPAVVPPAPVSTPPATPPTPPAPVITLTATPPAAETFGQFMARMGPVFAADPVRNTALMGQALASVGLTSVAQLAPRPDLIPSVSATFDALAAVPA